MNTVFKEFSANRLKRIKLNHCEVFRIDKRDFSSNVKGVKSSRRSHYEVLGLNEKCSAKEIKDAFVRLSKELHPDRNRSDPKGHTFVELNEAYSILSKPNSRRLYDSVLKNADMRSSSIYRHQGFGNLHRQDNAQDYRSRSHWHASGFYEFRDRSKDNFYRSQPYYGIKGVNKLPNWCIVAGCCVLVAIGIFGHYIAISFGNRISMEAQDRKDKIYGAVYARVKNRARELSTEEQINRLESHWKKNEANASRRNGTDKLE